MPKKKRKKPTGHIFGEKTRQRWGKEGSPSQRFKRTRGSSKRAQQKGLTDIFNVPNINDISKEDRADFKAYLREQQRKIKDIINNAEDTNPIVQDAIEDDLAQSNPVSPEDMLREYYRQQEFFSDIEEYTNDLNDAIISKDTELEALMTDADKWNILRRLAQVDQRLNIDRAYASQTLHDIEDMIEARSNYQTYQELADELIDNYYRTHSAEDIEDEMMHPFSQSLEDVKLVSNKGFHGIERAEEAWNRQYKKKATSTELSNYLPLWDNPFKFIK